MQTAITTRAPELVYIIIPLILAIVAVIILFLGSPGSAAGVALLAYTTSALGSLLKMDLNGAR
jgi:uncharacterized membrane protein YtjA (UPF0391 family)